MSRLAELIAAVDAGEVSVFEQRLICGNAKGRND